jgi:hypothetical protein
MVCEAGENRFMAEIKGWNRYSDSAFETLIRISNFFKEATSLKKMDFGLGLTSENKSPSCNCLSIFSIFKYSIR